MAVTVKGRYWMLFWLAVFLTVAVLVVARQKAALELATRLRTIRESRGALEARRAELERRIKTQSTAAALLPKVSPGGLGLPRDTSYTVLRVEPGAPGRDR